MTRRAHFPLPQRKPRRRGLISRSSSLRAGGWPLFSLRDLWGSGGSPMGPVAWGLIAATVTMLVLGGFLLQGGGVLLASESGRYSGARGDYVDCRYLTISGRTTLRAWNDGTTALSCPPLRQF